MRIYLELTRNTEPVPFAYQHYLIGRFHNWQGKNDEHDDISLYSLGWLKGGKFNGKYLDFHKGAKWMISAYNGDILRKIAEKALMDPKVFAGMEVKKITFQNTPEFNSKYTFRVGSPVLIKQRLTNGKIKFLTFMDGERADELMTKTLIHKMDICGLSHISRNVSVKFNKQYKNPKTKLVEIKNIKNKGSLCPVTVEGDPIAVRFAWDVGIGNCTGSGFGSLL